MADAHLIVGLGNPGEGYAQTRHNAGFQLVDVLAGRWRVRWAVERKFNARMAWSDSPDGRRLLCQPLSYMNLSGDVVQMVAAYYKVPPSRWMVVVDDADLPLGEIRLRSQGGSGGHHGLESIMQMTGTREFARLRIGIGRTPDGRRQITSHVLGQFSPAETELLKKVLARAGDQVECWLRSGLSVAMNQFNGVIDPEKEE